MLTGGPGDGTSVAVDRPPADYRIPLAPAFSLIAAEPDDSQLSITVGIYAPRIDVLGRVSRNDLGELVYDWQGTR
jgi:hypothetical protein